MSHPIASVGSEPAATLLAWSLEPAVTIPIAVTAALYWRGWTKISARMPGRFGAWRLAAFMSGLGALVLALCSPLERLGGYLLQAHMVQHMLLMLIAPPLLWAGAPVAPLLLGMPPSLRRAAAVLLAASPVRRLTTFLCHPAVSWTVFVAAFWLWHLPVLYELALRSETWHHVEHLFFFTTALLFWRPVVLAWPARSPWPRWAMIPYLLLAELQNTVLAAILTFADRVIYPTYATAPRLGSLSALEDQSIAGVIMWVPGSVAFLVPLLWLVLTGITAPAPRVGEIEAGRPQPALRRR